MKISTRLKKVRDCLLPILDIVGHYDVEDRDNDYIVWAEEGPANQLNLDNKVLEQAIEGTIDLYFKKEYSTYPDEIQDALNEAGISFELILVDYETETKFIHYEWRFQI